MIDAPPPLVRPVRGPVSAPFRYARSTPFAAGQRRVLRLRPAGAQPVRAACSGRVAFAGRAPGTTVVTLRCGGWAVTVSGLVAVRVGRGQAVRAGATVGRADRSPIALGVRRATDPFGYVDPEPLLREPEPPSHDVPAAPAPRTRVPAVAPAPRPVAAPARIPTPAARGARPVPGQNPTPTASRERPVPARAPDGPDRSLSPRPTVDRTPAVPPVAWIGLAVAALGLPAGVGRRLARSRTVRARISNGLRADRGAVRR